MVFQVLLVVLFLSSWNHLSVKYQMEECFLCTGKWDPCFQFLFFFFLYTCFSFVSVWLILKLFVYRQIVVSLILSLRSIFCQSSSLHANPLAWSPEQVKLDFFFLNLAFEQVQKCRWKNIKAKTEVASFFFAIISFFIFTLTI